MARPKALSVQDCKLNGREIGAVVAEFPAAPGSTVENLAHERMADHYDAKSGVQAVRIVDEDGTELYRWTWWDETAERQRIARKRMDGGPRGEHRTRGIGGLADSAWVVDNGQGFDINEQEYRDRDYQPPFDDLPWNES